MLRILDPADLPTIPWKNGGGVTREIAKSADEQGLLWRISLANVDADGPFSCFEGLTRILTVIDGDGIDLIYPDGVIAARWGAPVRFLGDLTIAGRLTNGPVRDLNLIFDATRVTAKVVLLTGPMSITIAPALMGCLALSGSVCIDEAQVPEGHFAIGNAKRLIVEPNAKALLLTITDPT